MLRVIYFSMMCFMISISVKASEDLVELDFARKGIVSCEGKERMSKYVKEIIISVCDVIDQVKEKIDPSKSYFLNLQDNALNNKAALEILNFVKNTSQIKKLDLSYNDINQILDTTEIEEVCASFISSRKDCQIILTGNNISFHLEQEESAPQKSGNNIIIEAF